QPAEIADLHRGREDPDPPVHHPEPADGARRPPGALHRHLVGQRAGWHVPVSVAGRLRLSRLGDAGELATVSGQPLADAPAADGRLARRDGARAIAAWVPLRHGASVVLAAACGGTAGAGVAQLEQGAAVLERTEARGRRPETVSGAGVGGAAETIAGL